MGDRERGFLTGDSALGLLDPFFLRGITHALFAESIHELEVGRIKLQRMQPGFAGVREAPDPGWVHPPSRVSRKRSLASDVSNLICF